MKFKTFRISVLSVAITAAAFCTSTPPATAQAVSPAIMQMAQGELQKRGLNEAEVRTRLMQEGINVDNIQPAEMPAYQSRVTAILDKMEAEKKAKGTEAAPKISINVGGTSTTTDAAPTTTTAEATPIIPTTTPQEATAEAKQRAVQAEAAKDASPIYGHALFTDHSLDVYRTTDGAQAPETYILGEGDEIHITIFGASQTDIQQKISTDGSIQPTGVAKIFLKGLTLAQARQVLAERLSSSYLFRPDQLAVTIVTARTILVNVFGETKITGGFTISALNSALNALSAAGGPTNMGSIRNIQLIRGNIKKNIDLYEFMSDPSVQFRFDLQNNDILFVPVAKKIVSIEGAVKRPMQYEMLSSEMLTDLIKYSGGLTVDAYPDYVQIQRFVDGEELLMEWKLKEVMTGRVKVPLLNGDRVRIKSISKPMDQYVDIDGSVYYPGRFDLYSNKKLSTILANAKPDYQAKTDFLFVERIRPDETVELLSVSFPDGKSDSTDFELQARDKVHVLNLATYRDVAAIAVYGQVRKPFQKTFSYNDRLSINQAIEYAGGLKNTAYNIAYIFRKNLFNPVETEYIRVDIDNSGKVLLQPGDELHIYDKTTYTDVHEISVQGAVRNPFVRQMALTDKLTVKQALEIAGGLRMSVYPVAYIFRRNWKNPKEMNYIKIELENSDNLELQSGDQLNIFDNTTFSNIGEIRVSGAVKNPSGYTYDPSMTVHDLLTNAGGFTVGAAFNNVEVFRTILSPTQKVQLVTIKLEVDSSYNLINPIDFSLQPYDHIVVRMTPEFTLGRTIEINGQVEYPGVYVLESKQTKLSDVINKAGGLLNDADPYGARLFRTYRNRGNITMNLKKAMNNIGDVTNDPILFEGDVININRQENIVIIRGTGTRMDQYTLLTDTMTYKEMLSTRDFKNIIYQGPRSAAWYIRNFAGGFQKNADRNSVTVTLPNNQTVATKRFLGIFRDYPTVKPGSTISLTMSKEKIEAENKPKEKVDWEGIASRGLSTLMSTLSIILLVQQLAK